MITAIKQLFLLSVMVGLLIAGCKKKDSAPPPAVPTLATTAVTNITATTATSGGNISSNGGAEITASGLCWSKTNNAPTITDDTTKTTTTSGSFTSDLKNLDPSATYYVRAYATNSVGTGYGNMVSFSAGNAAPEARNITITGDKTVGAELTAAYTYFDVENNPESGTSFQWYIANDSIGATVTPIAGATASTYTLASSDQSKFLKVGVIPKASAGASPGVEAHSYWVGPIGAETVTFMYNGAEVTYGVIVSATTGKKWLDRNLGAQRAATAHNDYEAYGDLFQWGRPADGHQLITWTGSTSNNGTPVNGTTTTLATTAVPGHANFILASSGNWDWLTPQNENLWQTNNPCPDGWHIPTNVEWAAENIKYVYDETFLQLKLTAAGMRREHGGLQAAGAWGQYWSSTISFVGGGDVFWFYDSERVASSLTDDIRAMGYSCRCIKDE